jgi:hypothetical protein
MPNGGFTEHLKSLGHVHCCALFFHEVTYIVFTYEYLRDATWPVLQGLHTIIRNKECPRGEFIFYSSRLVGLAMEYAMRYPLKCALLPCRRRSNDICLNVDYKPGLPQLDADIRALHRFDATQGYV